MMNSSDAVDKMTFQVIPTKTITSTSIKKTKKPLQKWTMKKIRFSSRDDTMSLSHWEKSNSSNKSYPFDELNIKSDMLMYTDDEYNLFIQQMDSNWNRTETNELFSLCERFDLRFHVIADRFSDKSKTVQELKKRYFSIAKAIAEYRMHYMKKSDLVNHSVMKAPYDYETDIRQKKMMLLLSARTEQDAIDESAVLERLKKIESIKQDRAKDKSKRKRDDLLSEPWNQPEDNPDKIKDIILPNMTNLKQGIVPVLVIPLTIPTFMMTSKHKLR
jgi:DNA methyltransferase 1-associated protein 1